MHELKKIVKVFTSKFVATGSSSYKKRIYRAAVSHRFRNTVLEAPFQPLPKSRATVLWQARTDTSAGAV